MTNYDNFLNKKVEVNLKDGIKVDNLQEAIKNGVVGLNQTKFNKFFPGEYIKSKNYVAGTSGWRFDGDGSAEFNTGGGSFASGYATRTTGSGSGEETITIGFAPKLIKITAIGDATTDGQSWGQWNSDGDNCLYSYLDGSNITKRDNQAGLILFVWDAGKSSVSSAEISSTTSTSFVIDWLAVNHTVLYLWEAFG